MCRASGACVLSTWHVKSTRCISTVKALLYRLSSCTVCLDTISQPGHLPRVHCHKGMVCQRGGVSIYIYMYIYIYIWARGHSPLHFSILCIAPNTILCGGCTDPSHAPYREVWYKPIYFNTHDKNKIRYIHGPEYMTYNNLNMCSILQHNEMRRNVT